VIETATVALGTAIHCDPLRIGMRMAAVDEKNSANRHPVRLLQFETCR
jgi:hypothetical protein